MGAVIKDVRSGRVIWAIRYKDVDGRVRKERTKALTKQLARRFLSMRENQVEKARLLGLVSVVELLVRKPALSVRQFSKEYLAHVEARCAASTAARYKGIVNDIILPKLGQYGIEAVNAGIVQRYCDDRVREKAAPATIHQELAVLSGLFSTARRREIVKVNPVPLVKKPRVENRIVRYLDKAEEAKLLAHSPEPLRSAILVSIHSGLRDGELRGLTWADVRFAERTIIVRGTKSKKDRVVPMSDTLYEVLKAMPRHDIRSPFVFTNTYTATKYDRFNNTPWRRAVKKAGLAKIRWHDLRHTFGSRLAQAGVPIQVIAELMGHASLSVTLRYAHLAPSNLTNAVKALDRKVEIAQAFEKNDDHAQSAAAE